MFTGGYEIDRARELWGNLIFGKKNKDVYIGEYYGEEAAEVTEIALTYKFGDVLSRFKIPFKTPKENNFQFIKSPVINESGQTIVDTLPSFFRGKGTEGTGGLSFTGFGMAEYDAAAEAAYNSIRSVKMRDVRTVADSTGLSIQEVTTMKKHLFFGKHKLPLEGGQGWKLERFAADDEIAYAWKAAQEGTLTPKQQEWFRQLANHELGERKLMGKGMLYRNPNSWNPKLELFESFPPGAHDAAPAQPNFNFPGYDPFKLWGW